MVINRKQMIIKTISEFATHLNNFSLLSLLRTKLMKSDLSNDLKVAVNDSYVDAKFGNMNLAKQNMLLIVQEVQNRLSDGYGLLQHHYFSEFTSDKLSV